MEKSDSFFPLFINLKNKKILIIGAGKIAYRKSCTLLDYGAHIKIITEKITEEKFYSLLKENKNLSIDIGNFSEEMLEDIFMVICATDNHIFNEKIYKICDEKNILVNNITSKIEMNCRFGSIVESEDYLIGISGKGNPQKAKALKEIIKEKFLKL